jgi:tetratricopeptide (TPR) repeat protein
MLGSTTLTRWRVLAVLVLAALIAFLYAPTLRHPFVYDDHVVIEKNRVVRSWSAAAATFARAEPVGGGEIGAAVYRPLSALTLAADHAAWGFRPAGYHLTNLLLHAASTVAAGLVARSLGAGEPAAWLAAALFAAHPIQTEVVCWPSSRPEALFTFFFLWAWAGRERLRARGRSAAAETWGLTFFALALLSKEMAITFPLLLALREVWLPGPGSAAAGGSGAAEPPPRAGVCRLSLLWRAARLAAPYAALAVVYFTWRLRVLGGLGSREQRAVTLWLGLLSMSIVFARYVALAAWPAGQNVEHLARIVESPFDVQGLVCLTALLALVAAGIVLAHRRRRAAAFGIAWWFAALLPVSNLIPIWSLMAERFLYLPSLGLFVAGATLLLDGGRWLPARRAAALACLAALGAATVARVPVWSDELRFWDDVIAKSPAKIKAHNNRGEVLLRLGRLPEAEASFRNALSLNPRGPMANYNLARLAEMRGRLAEAEELCRRALEVNPGLVDAWKTLGDVRLKSGSFGEAEAAYREFLARREDPRVRYNRAVALYNQGALEEAGAEAGRAAALEPRLEEPERLLGLVAQKLGRDSEAETHYRRALALAPSAEAHYNLAVVQQRQGRLDQAIASFEAAARLAPRARPVWEALARAYAEAGRPADAARAGERARALSGPGSR